MLKRTYLPWHNALNNDNDNIKNLVKLIEDGIPNTYYSRKFYLV